MNQGHGLFGCLAAVLAVFFVLSSYSAARTQTGQFVGSGACQECHETEYENFRKYSKKAHSGDSVKIMASDLTKTELAECFGCHVTGYGKPGGFVSFEQTPQLSDAGCEVCHGPGYDHVDSGGDPELIKGKLTVEDCESCHNAERVAAFDYKPLIFGGAH